MADCVTKSGEYVSQSSSDFASKMRELYPECGIFETPGRKSNLILSVQPRSDIDLELKFRISNEDSQSIHFVSLTSNSLTKKELQPLERSLELQATISENGQVLEEAIYIVNSYIKAESFCERNKTSDKKKKKKSKNIKSDSCIENAGEQTDCLDKELVSKRKGKKGRNRSRNMNFSDDDDEEELTLDSIYGSTFQEQTHETVRSSLSLSARPTHFIAVRITSKSILDGLTSSQKELVSCEPLLEKGVFAPEILHLTLLTLGLDSPEDIENCIQALKEMSSSLEKSRPLQPFVVHGMSQFYNRAIFSKVQVEQDFLDFRDNLRSGLESFNVEIRDVYEKFNPHLTIIKVKRPERKLFGHRNIQPAIYSHIKDVVFGEQKVEEIHLCSMDGQRREDGFYVSLFEIKFES